MFLIQNVLHKTSSSFIQAVARTLRGQIFQGTSKNLETIKQACDDLGRGSIMCHESGHKMVCACARHQTCHYPGLRWLSTVRQKYHTQRSKYEKSLKQILASNKMLLCCAPNLIAEAHCNRLRTNKVTLYDFNICTTRYPSYIK